MPSRCATMAMLLAMLASITPAHAQYRAIAKDFIVQAGATDATATEKMRVTQSGLVGVGLSAPTYQLDVSGTARATKFIGDGSALTNIGGDDLGNHTATTTIKAINGTAALPAYTWSGDPNTGLYWAAADQIGLSTGGAQRALLNASGLTVTGYVSTTGVIDAGGAIYGFAGDSVTAPGYTWSGDTNTGMYWVGADQLGLTAGGVQRVLVNTTGLMVTGNVGVGTTAPAYKLDVAGGIRSYSSGYASLIATTTSSTNYADLGLVRVSSTWWWSNRSAALQLINSEDGGSTFKTPMVISSSGNVGIGTLTPSERLEVVGNVKATKFIGDGSSLTNVGGDDLGNHTATTTIKAINGTAALPAYTWAGDTNTGIYLAAADQIGLSTGGAQRSLLNASGLTVTGYVSTTGVIDAGGAIYGFAGDSAAAPGYTWSGDTNTGMYWVGADQLGLSTGGAQRVLVNGSGATITGNIITTGQTTGYASIELGNGRTGDGGAYIDLHGDTTYSDYGLRIIRGTSANAASQILHRGTGTLQLATQDGGTVSVAVSGSTILTVNTSGAVLAGSLNMGSNKITALATPTTTTDAANKAYVDAAVAGGGDDLGNHTATATIKGINGTAALPAYTWAGDTNTGMYWAAADQIGLATGGVQHALLTTSGLIVTGYVSTTGVIDAGGAIYGFAGDSVTAPGYTWSGDTNTGMYWVGADQLGLTAGGVQRVLVNTTGATVTGNLTATKFIGDGSSLTNLPDGDTIASGTTSITANGTGSSISLTTAGTTWGYLRSIASYIPNLVSNAVSTTAISTSTINGAPSSSWTIPTGAIMAFDLATCPSGWSEYTAARGRFLRGIDNGAGNDPDGTRAPGTTQADAFKSHSHGIVAADITDYAAAFTINDNSGDQLASSDNITSGVNAVMRTSRYGTAAAGVSETRPKNVAVLFCRKN